MEQVRALIRQAEYAKALELVTPMVTTLPQQPCDGADTIASSAELRNALRLRGICSFHLGRLDEAAEDFRSALSLLTEASPSSQRRALEQLLHQTCEAAVKRERDRVLDQLGDRGSCSTSHPRSYDGGEDVEASRGSPSTTRDDASFSEVSRMFPGIVGVRFLLYKSYRASPRFEALETYAKTAWLAEKLREYSVTNVDFLLRYLKKTPGIGTCTDLLHLEYQNAWGWCNLALHLPPGDVASIAHQSFTRRELFIRSLELRPDYSEAWCGLSFSVSPEGVFLELAAMLRKMLENDKGVLDRILQATSAAEYSLWDPNGVAVESLRQLASNLSSDCVERLLPQCPHTARMTSAVEIVRSFDFQSIPMAGVVPGFFEDMMLRLKPPSGDTGATCPRGGSNQGGSATAKRRGRTNPLGEASFQEFRSQSSNIVWPPARVELDRDEATVFLRQTLFAQLVHAAVKLSVCERVAVHRELHDAASCAEKAVQSKPDYADAWLALGKSHCRELMQREQQNSGETALRSGTATQLLRRTSSSGNRIGSFRRRGSSPESHTTSMSAGLNREQSFASFARAFRMADVTAARQRSPEDDLNSQRSQPRQSGAPLQVNGEHETILGAVRDKPSTSEDPAAAYDHEINEARVAAVTALIRCLKSEIENSDAWWYLSLCVAAGEKICVDDMVLDRTACLERCLRFRRDFPEAWLRMGRLLAEGSPSPFGEQKKWTPKECYAVAIRYRWEYVDAWATLAMEMSDREDSVAIMSRQYNQQSCLEMLLRYKPDHALGWLNLGTVLPAGATSAFSSHESDGGKFTLHASAEKKAEPLSVPPKFIYSKQQCFGAAARWDPQCREAWGALARELHFGEACVHGRVYTQDQCLRRARGEPVEGTPTVAKSTTEESSGCIVS